MKDVVLIVVSLVRQSRIATKIRRQYEIRVSPSGADLGSSPMIRVEGHVTTELDAVRFRPNVVCELEQ